MDFGPYHVHWKHIWRGSFNIHCERGMITVRNDGFWLLIWKVVNILTKSWQTSVERGNLVGLLDRGRWTRCFINTQYHISSPVSDSFRGTGPATPRGSYWSQNIWSHLLSKLNYECYNWWETTWELGFMYVKSQRKINKPTVY